MENTASSADGANSSSSVPAVTDQHKELTTHATQEFDKGSFSQCVSWMAKLSKARGTDPKVVHNHAVAVFYQSNQCAVEELKNGLNAACQLVLSLSASEVLWQKTNKKVCLQFSYHYPVILCRPLLLFRYGKGKLEITAYYEPVRQLNSKKLMSETQSKLKRNKDGQLLPTHPKFKKKLNCRHTFLWLITVSARQQNFLMNW